MIRSQLAIVCVGVAVATLAQADPVDFCGQIVRGVECALFQADGGERYVLDDPGNFSIGDRVRVRGERDQGCVSICLEGDGCISVAGITYCDGEITACGTLVDGVECVLFEDDGGFLFVIENRGSFAVGDRVLVRGQFSRDCASICQQETGCIADNSIEPSPTDGNCDRNDEPGSGACPLTTAGLLLAGAWLCRAPHRPGV